MKKIFIIDGYPKTERQKKMLDECIESIKSIGWDILLVSHYPVPSEIQEKVEYCIYDKNNLFVPPNISPHVFFGNDLFDYKFYLESHALAITISIFNGFKFAQDHGYDFCYFMECDSIIAPDDLKKMESLVYQMEDESKSMIIFNPESFIVRDCYYKEEGNFFYETLLFGARIDQFLERFKPPRNLEEWMGNDMCYNLEACLYHKYKDIKDECLIIPTFVREYLTESKINSHRSGLFVCGVVYNETDPEIPILLVDNLYENTASKEIKIYLNDIPFNNFVSYPGAWYYTPLTINGDRLKIEVFEGESLESSEIVEMVPDLLNKLKEKLSFIKFKSVY